MITLGFTGKFYARWESTIVTDECCNFNDRHYEHIDNKYLGKVANDYETAHKKFPDLTLNDKLNGKKRSFCTYNNVVYDSIETFRYGKYNGKRIDEANDGSYIAWYIGTLEPGDHRNYCVNILIKFHGYTLNGEELISPEAMKKINEAEKRTEKIVEKAKNDKHVFLELKRWPDENGDVTVDGVTYTFADVKKYCYDGFVYYMPLLNGKAKRIKNKVIKANLAYLYNKIYICDFEIVMK